MRVNSERVSQVKYYAICTLQTEQILPLLTEKGILKLQINTSSFSSRNGY